MKLSSLILAVVFCFAVSDRSLADTCQTTSLQCLSGGDIYVAGVRIAGGCVSIERGENCNRANPANTCGPLAAAAQSPSNPLTNGQCKQISSDANSCTRMVNGVCDSWYRQYQCWNGPVMVAGATLESRQFRNLAETYPSNCAPLTSNTSCKLEATRITQGFQSRIVNELDVSRAWWAREHDYDCTSSTYEETCGQYAANPICEPTGEVRCLGYGPNGSCEYEEVKYHCQADAAFTAQCEGVEVCVGDNCLGVEAEASQDFPKAAAWLNFLDDASKENRCTAQAATGILADVGMEMAADSCVAGKLNGGHLEPAVFKGKLKACNRNWVNCCSEYAYSGLCSSEDAALKDAEKAGVVHHLETVCNGWFLGICTSRAQNYCVYDSKFARVFQQQAHAQTGSQLNHGCPALTIEQLEGIDVNEMDLSEVFGDMLDQATKPVEKLVIDRLSTQMGIFRTDVQETFE